MNSEKAACYCGNISAEILLSKPVTDFEPRACDCDFCDKHGAAYISDAQGRMNIRVSDSDRVVSCQHGSGMANFLICGSCGVLFGVTYTSGDTTYGSLNSKTLDNRHMRKRALSTSPKSLSESDKVERWSQVWFPDVIISK